MVASECAVKSKSSTGNKVSKPLMEKKRRARINKCLEQLKTLLESYYANSIRKRKLEKADILELTVKHLRNLQSIQSAAAAAPELSEYQMGFRNCLANVNRYLLMADNLNASDRWMLSQLSGKLRCSRGPAEACSPADSTMDSSPRPRLEPASAAPEDHRAAQSSSITLQPPPSEAELSSALTHTPTRTHTRLIPAPTRHSREQTPTGKKFPSAISHRSEERSLQQDMWRPW
ncbi:hairy-related 3 [Genypterus blacodes]|uniref:hairy-related 3 n=1 Tax=Genypterus blacodes TaxID=154954 RepID=UPI003F765FBF